MHKHTNYIQGTRSNTGAQTHNPFEACLDDETDYAAQHDQLTKHSLRPLRVKIAQKRRVYYLIL